MFARFICHNRYGANPSGYTPNHPGDRRNNGLRWRRGANGKQHYRDHDKHNDSLVHGSLLLSLPN
jgi:hypothetical protein